MLRSFSLFFILLLSLTLSLSSNQGDGNWTILLLTKTVEMSNTKNGRHDNAVVAEEMSSFLRLTGISTKIGEQER